MGELLWSISITSTSTCAPNEMPKATLSQVAGKPFRFFQVFFFVKFHGAWHATY